ncbi:PAS domain-containing protein [Priestia abyssalis]|uniref:PAS domain-containing protein n=1 Tax=Priestia abyssalis TaxID=1221450 RepID=UPI0009958B47|nr:PAS domain-containing protein [Priestia abyssalis]
MEEINLLHFMSKLLDEYQILYGKMDFTFKKTDHTFTITDVSPTIVELVKLTKSNIVGKSLDQLVSNAEIKKKLNQLFEKAWCGEESFCYCIPPKNKEIFLLIILKPVMKEGERAIGEGGCFPLSQEEFQKHNIADFERCISLNGFND